MLKIYFENKTGVKFKYKSTYKKAAKELLKLLDIKETINAAKKSTPTQEKKVDGKKESKSSKTIEELDREKLEKKFPKTKKETLN